MTAIGMLLNCIFIEKLPVEFFYIDQLWYYFGGIAVFSLGTYGYIATYTKIEERSYMLARSDGISLLGQLLGIFHKCITKISLHLNNLETIIEHTETPT